MNWRIAPGALGGEVSVPGDKSIGHRALMLAGLARGRSYIRNLPHGQDVRSTASCMTALGVQIATDNGLTTVDASGTLQQASEALDAGNSGTTMRLLSGILAGQSFSTTVTGDHSLCGRPMSRVIEPLQLMGAHIHAHDGRAPLTISGGDLEGIRYRPPMASAQVKSCTMLAGLFAHGDTAIIEPVPTRNHTEVMLRGAGVAVEERDGEIVVHPGRPHTLDLTVPGDISSAAFFLAAGALGGNDVQVHNVGVNPTRTGFLHVLERMGVRVELHDERLEGGEQVATIQVHGRVSSSVTVTSDEIPLLVDELPLVVLLATQAEGISTISGAEELRYKESDRIAAVTGMLNRLGARVVATPDGFVVQGATPLHGAEVDSGGDHRLAMMLAVAGSISGDETVIHGAGAAAVSYPSFADDFRRLDGRLAEA